MTMHNRYFQQLPLLLFLEWRGPKFIHHMSHAIKYAFLLTKLSFSYILQALNRRRVVKCGLITQHIVVEYVTSSLALCQASWVSQNYNCLGGTLPMCMAVV
jgi:hypothetical protein